MTNSEKKLQSLSVIFKENVEFIVPDYQRGYSWEQKQLDDLWEDLDNMTENSYHYTGMFTFCERESENDTIQYDIVDGQQRMTTLVILINELLNQITEPVDEFSDDPRNKDLVKKYLYRQSNNSDYKRYRFRYLDEVSDTFFVSKILEQSDGREFLYSDPTLYTNNLAFAKNYFKEKIKDYSQQKLVALFNKVTKKLVFNEYQINDINDVYVTFETMNNRGKSLSTLELLKNRLIYLTTIFASKPSNDQEQQFSVKELRNNIDNTWKTIYKYLGKSTEKKLGDDDFLKDHWIMYFTYDRRTSNVFKSFLLSDVFTAKNVLTGKCTIKTVSDYVDSLRKSVAIWFNLSCPMESDGLTEEERMWLTRFEHVGGGRMFKPLLMAVYSKKNRDGIVDLIKACERFLFLVYHVSRRRSNVDDTRFYTKAREYYYASEESLNIQSVVREINARIKQWYSKERFVEDVVDKYRNHEGFFSWNGIRYFLYEYEKTLQDKTKDKDDKVVWNKIFEKNQEKKDSIEHIFPQTPTDSYWVQRFPDDKDRALTHSLGNLLLISRPHNSELRNHPFATPDELQKKPSKKDIYKNGSYSEIEVAQKEEWSPVEIINRGKGLLDFLVKHWEIDVDLEVFTEEDVDKLLNINSIIRSAKNEEIADKEYDDGNYYDDIDLEE